MSRERQQKNVIQANTMSSYQLTCVHCGDPIVVGIAKAGATVSCPSCGQSVEVPGTKQLRALPLANAPAAAKGSSGDRPASQGGSLLFRVLLGTLLGLSFLGLGYGSYLAYARWNAPIEFGHTEEELYTDFYDRAMQDPPARVWDHFNYLVEAGIPNPQPPDYFIINRHFEKQKPWMIGSLIGGGAAFLCFLGLSIVGSRLLGRK